MNASPYFLAKQHVADSFSRAARSYDAAAHLQKRVGVRLLRHFIAQTLPVGAVLDIGCGTGFITEQLTKVSSDVIGLDLAGGMVQFAQQQYAQAGLTFVQGDAEYLPLANGSCAAVFSSLALQWCQNLPQLTKELSRVLHAHGKLVMATLGPQTLYELRDAWQQVDRHVHVNEFVPSQVLVTHLETAGFIVERHLIEEEVLYFPHLNELMHELKSLGARNRNAGQAQGLSGRAKLRGLTAAYELNRRPQGLPATYEVVYLVARKP